MRNKTDFADSKLLNNSNNPFTGLPIGQSPNKQLSFCDDTEKIDE